MKSNFKKIILLLLTITAASTGIYLYSHKSGSIQNYSASQDKDFILKLFKDNWHWLISGNSTYSTDYVSYYFDNKAPDRKPENLNKLIIKVYRVNGKPAGFTAYHMKEFYEGHILFLGVDEKARQKGIGRKLLRYAMNDLKKQGATHLTLITRVTNTKAQKLYESEGFKNIGLADNGNIIRYRLDLI